MSMAHASAAQASRLTSSRASAGSGRTSAPDAPLPVARCRGLYLSTAYALPKAPHRASAQPPERLHVQILQVLFQVVLGITSILLTLLILLHKGRGGGLSDMFGGGVTSNLGASGVAERNLNRFTVILGLVWLTSIVVLGLITKFDSAV